MLKHFEELLSCLNANGVRYLVIGGYAVGLHAQPRATKDLDLFYSPDARNAEVLFRALVDFGAPLSGLRAEDLSDSNNFFRFGNPPLRVELLPVIDGVDFESAWSRKLEAQLDSIAAFPVHFIGRD